MITCPDCSAQNREGVLFCENCGFPFVEELHLPAATYTEKFKKQATKQLDSPTTDEIVSAIESSSSDKVTVNTQLVMHVQSSNQTIKLHQQSEVVIGRADTNMHSYPDLDLTPYGALDFGISRTHAAIRRTEAAITLVDLKSANGTFLNGNRLDPDQPHILRDGDEITFGKLVLRIFFK